MPSPTLSLQLFPLPYKVLGLMQDGRPPRECTITVLFANRRNETVIVNLGICEPYPSGILEDALHSVTMSPIFVPSHAHHCHHPCPFPVIDLLSHPTLGKRRTRGSSSKVRVARQGTEFSSGLRALVSEAEDRKRRRTHEQPQQG